MARLLLIRHAEHGYPADRLAGRLPQVSLSARGIAQAQRLAAALSELAELELSAVYSSPLERAVETATAIASAHSLPLRVENDLNEVEFGEWTGRSFDELAGESAWRAFNEFRSTACPPGGEPALETQRRMVCALVRLAATHGNECIAVVSHADPIRYALVHFLGMPLDLLLRLELAHASVSSVLVSENGIRVLCVNDGSSVRDGGHGPARP